MMRSHKYHPSPLNGISMQCIDHLRAALIGSIKQAGVVVEEVETGHRYTAPGLMIPE